MAADKPQRVPGAETGRPRQCTWNLANQLRHKGDAAVGAAANSVLSVLGPCPAPPRPLLLVAAPASCSVCAPLDLRRCARRVIALSC